MLKRVEYIWLDGTVPTPQLRSKTKIIAFKDEGATDITEFPEWSFDGSSTQQAAGSHSDCILRPVSFVNDPLSEMSGYLVLCEVFNHDGSPHASNTRAILRRVLENGGAKHDFWVGFEQEYTLFSEGRPLGWPEKGEPEPQGPYYCGVGANRVFGRDLVEMHLQACMDAGLMIYGINAEVMPGQWEFQVGYRGIEGESADALTMSDHRYFALWLLYRLGEIFKLHISIDNKPVKGDWNGAGCHTNFSTYAMRDKNQGAQAIEHAITALGKTHQAHIVFYGDRLHERLTGQHETASIEHFSAGEANRSASIRIPPYTAEHGYGYLEDRRPGANCDAYLVCARLISTICTIEDEHFNEKV